MHLSQLCQTGPDNPGCKWFLHRRYPRGKPDGMGDLVHQFQVASTALRVRPTGPGLGQPHSVLIVVHQEIVLPIGTENG